MPLPKAFNMAVMAVSMCQMLDLPTKRKIIEALTYAEEKLAYIIEEEENGEEN